MPARSTITPSVQAQSVNEWPEPTAFTSRPSAAADATTSDSSSSEAGVAIAAGAQRCSPAQFVQFAAAMGGDPNECLAPLVSAT